MFTRSILVSLKRKACRKKVWFKILSEGERALVNALIKVIDVVRSRKLGGMLASIAEKIASATEGFLEKARRIGRPLALQISSQAIAWGNSGASNWTKDLIFAEFLGMQVLNDPYWAYR